ncbi:MAG TPA: methanogenesis marker 7 protein [Methanofastidiosum sp.]|jgi:putative methanogenesis marker protein 7|nr:methanogenesis marker 7 protein [Candidatus Methanofastidiosa archaeon]HOM96438.1 methanogenesis marker 7 protein [Methanofastidiosum sp.]HOT85471.1 methanogenesis marker 7 protein [Methanofastidiosum sp.]HPC80542.1 methanogenesis marker 7 protein [Methanofastidiosum sp.]HQF90171.1 methanogenesis marker 7 protein [Methanofastidiosum sp.]
MFKMALFEGGLHRADELEDLVDDIGGFLIQKNVTQIDITLIIAVPGEDYDLIVNKAKELRGKLVEVPLAGSEITIVAPSLGKHHLPHPVCDISEYIRRNGAVTNVMGLARGVGQRINQITAIEKGMIEEADIAVFSLGNFSRCLRKKTHLFLDIDIPVVLLGGPEQFNVEGLEYYVGGIGRRSQRLRQKYDLDLFNKMVDEISKAVENRRREIEEDPLILEPMYLKKILEENVEGIDKIISPIPIVLNVDGVKVKMPLNQFKEKIKNVEFDGRKIEEYCNIYQSPYSKFTILKIYTKSYFDSLKK